MNPHHEKSRSHRILFIALCAPAVERGTPVEWGRMLDQRAREQRNPFPSLQHAVRQLGDACLVEVEKHRLHAQFMTITQRRDHHEQAHRSAWIDWLHGKELEMQQHSPEDYTRFTARRERERAELAADPKPWSRRMLDHFDTDPARLSRLLRPPGFLAVGRRL